MILPDFQVMLYHAIHASMQHDCMICMTQATASSSMPRPPGPPPWEAKGMTSAALTFPPAAFPPAAGKAPSGRRRRGRKWCGHRCRERWPDHGELRLASTLPGIFVHMAVCQMVLIAGKWMFIPLKMVLIAIDPYPYQKNLRGILQKTYCFPLPTPQKGNTLGRTLQTFGDPLIIKTFFERQQTSTPTGPTWLSETATPSTCSRPCAQSGITNID